MYNYTFSIYYTFGKEEEEFIPEGLATNIAMFPCSVTRGKGLL